MRQQCLTAVKQCCTVRAMDNQALLQAIAVCGTQAELARRIKATTAQVNEWTKGNRPVPPSRCEAIEKATGIKCEDIRSDLEWTRDKKGRVFWREKAKAA